LVLLPKMKQLFLFANLTSDHMYVRLLVTRNHFLQQRLILEFLVVIVTENVFFRLLISCIN